MTKIPVKKKCLNPDCPNDGFLPRRSNQLHCDGCKNKRHNARHKKDRETRFAREIILRNNLKRMEYISQLNLYPDGVPAVIVRHEKINLRTYTDCSMNESTNGTIYWSHDYGIEIISKNPTFYKIHQRK